LKWGRTETSPAPSVRIRRGAAILVETNLVEGPARVAQDQPLERILSKSERIYCNHIAGRWIDADGRRLEILDPSDGSHLADIRAAAHDVRAVEAARAALAGDWDACQTDRGRIPHRIGEGVLKNVSLLAELKHGTSASHSQARADVEALARYFEF
jgi:aldehyde dehydrogenase (NAD+)